MAQLSLIIGGDTLSASAGEGWHLLGATLDTSTGSALLYLDGVDEAGDTVSADLPAASLYPIQTGGQTVSGGVIGVSVPQDFAELLVFRSALSTADRQKIEGYLAHRWGTADALPDDHPYKAAPPQVDQPVPPEPAPVGDSAPDGYFIVRPAKGQNWASLAFRYYYDEGQFPRIIAANPALSDLITFEGTEAVLVPIVSTDELAAADDATPPWRR